MEKLSPGRIDFLNFTSTSFVLTVYPFAYFSDNPFFVNNFIARYKNDLIQTLKLSIPIVVAQLGVVLMGVTDNMIIGNLLGAVPLGGAGIATSVTFLIGSIGIGGLSIVSALISKARGEDNPAEIKRLYIAGKRVAWLLSLVLGTISLVLAWNFEIFRQTPAVAEIARPFMIILTLSNVALINFTASRQLCDGLSRPKVTMYITLSALVLNAGLNFLLISWIGVQGSALATLIARVYMAAAIVFYIRKDAFFTPYLRAQTGIFDMRGLMQTILKLGLPGGFQYFFEIAAFALAVVMIGWLGEVQLAAHQIAINLASTTYMMATGIGAAGSIRVAMALGKKSLPDVKKAATAALLMVTFFMGLCFLLFLSANEFLVSLYIRSDPAVASVAACLIIIAAFFQLSDGIQVVSLGALRGVSDVNKPTMITLFAYWGLALPVSYLLAFPFKLDVTGVWYGLSTGLTVSAILLTIRFYRNLKYIKFDLKPDNQTNAALS